MTDHNARLDFADAVSKRFDRHDEKEEELDFASIAEPDPMQPVLNRREFLPHSAVTFDTVEEKHKLLHGGKPHAAHPALGELVCILNVDAARVKGLPHDWGKSVTIITVRPETLYRPFCQLCLLFFGSSYIISPARPSVGPRCTRTRWRSWSRPTIIPARARACLSSAACCTACNWRAATSPWASTRT